MNLATNHRQTCRTIADGSARRRPAGGAENTDATGKIFSRPAAFTPCRRAGWVLDKINFSTAASAVFGDVILLSSACSSFDQFRNQDSGEVVCMRSWQKLADATGGMRHGGHHNRQTCRPGPACELPLPAIDFRNLLRGFFEEKPRRNQPQPDLNQTDANPRH
jgi:hypothetical protein